MNLHEKLLEIQKAVQYLKKDNKGYQYQYVSSSQTLGAIRSKMDELGVLLIPSVTGNEVKQYESKKEGNLFLTCLSFNFTWMDAANPADCLTCPWYAQGSDNGERGVGKAATYGEKFFLLKFFHIATDSEDPDSFQERRVEAGKRRKSAVIPPQPPAPTQERETTPAPSQAHYPKNPWFGKLVNLSAPTTGETNGRTWTKWDIETQEMNLTTFDREAAQVAMNAIQDHCDVEIVWKVKKSIRTGVELCTLETIRILEAGERAP